MSLQTRHFRRAEYLAGLLDPVFASACAMSVLKSDITAILRQHLQEQLDADLRQHLAARPGRGVYSPMADDGDDPFAPDRLFIEERLHEAIVARGSRDTGSVSGDVDVLMQQHGLAEDRRQELALGVLQTNVQFWQQAIQRLESLTGEVSLSALPAETAATAAPIIEGPKFSEILPGFVAKMEDKGKWRPHASNQNQATYRLFMACCGDKPLCAYTRGDAVDFTEMLGKFPPDWSYGPRWRNKTPQEIVAAAREAGVNGLASKTIKRHASALGSLFGYFIKRAEHPGPNPFHELNLSDSGQGSTERDMWEGDELSRLFNSPLWHGRHARFRSKTGPHIIKDSYFWLPILGLYHGNRLEEFAQLRRQDVKQIAGIWVLHITDESGGMVKNEQSVRYVPLHPILHRLGFIDHVANTAPNPTSLVFPDLKPGGKDGKLSHDWSGEFSSYRRKIGVYRKGLDYHSFRHGVTTKLFDAGVSTGIVDELTGHEGEGESRTRYKKRSATRPEQAVPGLFDAICKVQWPEVDLRHLYVDGESVPKVAG